MPCICYKLETSWEKFSRPFPDPWNPQNFLISKILGDTVCTRKISVFIMTCPLWTSQRLVSFSDPTTHARKGSGDIGADSWFCKLSNHVIICIDLYWCMWGHVMVRKTKKTLQCPQTLSLLRVGSGNETTQTLVADNNEGPPISV